MPPRFWGRFKRNPCRCGRVDAAPLLALLFSIKKFVGVIDSSLDTLNAAAASQA
jgi:hypothetical protein